MKYQAIPTHFLANDELVDFLLSNGYKESFKDVEEGARLFVGPARREVYFVSMGGGLMLYTPKSGYNCGPAIASVALLFWMQQNPENVGQREVMDLLTRAEIFYRAS